MDIIIKGRHTSIPERFRQHAASKLSKLERLDHKAIRIDVELTKERNPRQSGHCERVELTIRSRGPVIRAEAAADDRYTALDMALAKLEARLRRACDRRKERERQPDRVEARSGDTADTARDRQWPAGRPGVPRPAAPLAVSPEPGGSVPGAVAVPPGPVAPEPSGAAAAGAAGTAEASEASGAAEAEEASEAAGRRRPGAAGPPGVRLVPIEMEGDGPLVVREKFHAATPMTIDQALLEMELVGHDFYLFHDSGCGLFSVVYRRRGYDYGVIRLLEKQE